MIRRTRRGDIITNRHTRSTKPSLHFSVGTTIERITVATERNSDAEPRGATPTISAGERHQLRLIAALNPRDAGLSSNGSSRPAADTQDRRIGARKRSFPVERSGSMAP
jgi:hypothetical protein